MRFFAVILLSFTILLAFQPCADAVEVVQEVEQIDDCNSHDHQSEQDDCLPLCVCHCCQTHLTIGNTYDLAVAEVALENSSDPNMQLPNSWEFDIFHPPQRKN